MLEIPVSRVIGKDQARIAIDAPGELEIARAEVFEELDTAHGLLSQTRTNTHGDRLSANRYRKLVEGGPAVSA